MSFVVDWLPSVEQDLADIWTRSADQAEAAAAANAIDEALQRHPLDVGEARADNSRILFETPLVVLYDVHEPNRHVRVWDIWRYPPD